MLSLKIPPYLKCVSTLRCEMSGVSRSTIENKTTSVTTHFMKLITGNNTVYALVNSKNNSNGNKIVRNPP